MRKRNTFTVTQIEVVHTEERKSNSTSESKERTDWEPPSMKMIGVVESKHTKSSNSKEENYFESKHKNYNDISLINYSKSYSWGAKTSSR